MADETPSNAGAGESGGAAFNILGRIEVDLEALRKSLDKSKDMVKEHGGALQRIWSEATKVSREEVKIPGGARGEGEGGGGGEGGARHSATAEFAHMARILRHDLVPALAELNPALAQWVSLGAQSARTAVFFGGAIGGVAIAGAILSGIVGKYVEQAKEMTSATLEATQSLNTLDTARAAAAIKSVTDAFAAYNLEVQIAKGEEPANALQRLFASLSILSEDVGGTLEARIKKLFETTLPNAIKAGMDTTVLKAQAEAQRNTADVLGRQAQTELKSATTTDTLTAAYDKNAEAIRNRTRAALLDLRADENSIRAKNDEIRRTATGAFEKATTHQWNPVTGDFDAKVAESSDIYRRARTQLDARLADADAQLTQDLGQNANKRKKAYTDETEALDANAKQRREEAERIIQLDARRVESASATGKAVAAAEQGIAEVLRTQRGEVEGLAQLDARLAKERAFDAAPIVARIAAETSEYARQKKELEGLTEAAAAAVAGARTEEQRRDAAALMDMYAAQRVGLERTSADAIAQIRDKLTQAEVANEEKAAQAHQARVEKELAREDRLLAHRVAMGRATMQDQMASAGAGMYDPRRTVPQQEQQEEHLFALKRQYADAYFQYYDQVGKDTWGQQIDNARHFLIETVEGSAKWFDAVTKIFDVYKGIYEQARGVVQQTAGLAATEFQREVEEGKPGRKAPQGPMMRLQDIDQLVRRAYERDRRIYAGEAARPGDVTGALGRWDMWKEMQRTGMNFSEAFARIQQTPQERLAATLSDVATRQTSAADLQVAAGDKFSSAVDKFDAAINRFGSGGGGEDIGRYVLSTEPAGLSKYRGSSNAEDSRQGRALLRGADRGPNP